MSIIILGTITRDTLVFPGERSIQSLGGMLYEAIGLATLCQDLIIPIANVGSDIFDQVVSLLSAYPNISLDGLSRVPQPNYHVSLCHFTEFGCQMDKNLLPPISFNQIQQFLDVSYILITFISGFDLSLNTLRKISKFARCPIYIDYHCLAWGIDIENNRFLRRRPNWLNYISMANFVQFNNLEARLVWKNPIDTNTEALNFGKTILNMGSQAVIITFGAAGSTVIYRNSEDYELLHIDAQNVIGPICATGCGAVYSAGFISHQRQGFDIPSSCKFASMAAAIKCNVSGVEDLGKALSPLKDVYRRM